MSIKKYITLEDAERDLWEISAGKDSFKEVFAVFHLKHFKKVFRCPSGVFKYKTIQDANVDAEKWLKISD